MSQNNSEQEREKGRRQYIFQSSCVADEIYTIQNEFTFFEYLEWEWVIKDEDADEHPHPKATWWSDEEGGEKEEKNSSS